MKRNKVESSTIKTIGWESDNPKADSASIGTLYIQFVKGGPKGYCYNNVPERIFHTLMNANIANHRIGDSQMSIGSLFHDLIKSHPKKYPYINLDKV